ncbi:MAG: DUF4838 domain-containing protein [Planctomycetota bacterium]
MRNQTPLLLTALSLILLAGCGTMPHPGEMFEDYAIVSQGRSDATIVLSPDAAPAERFAAQELQRYVRQITGVTLPIGGMSRQGPHIFVGTVEHVSKQVFLWDFIASLDEETVVVWPRGGDLVLAGGSPRATLWAVYDLLERLGCRFYRPDSMCSKRSNEIVPQQPFISLPRTQTVSKPNFRYRIDTIEPLCRDLKLFPHVAQRIDWLAKQRINTLRAPFQFVNHPTVVEETRKRGMQIVTGGGDALPYLMPFEKHGKAHPDWFMEVGDLKITDIGNAKAAEEFCKNLCEFMTKNPQVAAVAVWMPDTDQWVRGGDRASHLSATETYITFINRAAKALAEAAPDRRLMCIACGSTLEPPMRVKPEGENLWLEFAAPGCRQHAINDPACSDVAAGHVNARNLEWLRRWREINPGILTSYEYSEAAFGPAMPDIVANKLAADLRCLKEEQVVGLFDPMPPFAMWTYAPDATVRRSLLWDVEADPGALLDDYCAHVFGDHADAARQCYNILHGANLWQFGYHQQFRRPSASADIEDSLKKLDECLALVAKTGAKDEQMQKLSLVLEHGRLWVETWFRLRRYEELKAAGRRQDALKDLLAAREAFDKWIKLREQIIASGDKGDWLHEDLVRCTSPDVDKMPEALTGKGR